MNQIITSLISAFILVMAFMAGATLFFVLLIAGFFVWSFFALRRLWAKMLGKPVTPFGFTIDPRGGFQRAYGSVRSRTPNARSVQKGEPSDITDVIPRQRTDSD